MTDIEGLHQTIYKAVHGRVSVFLGREDFANAIWLGTEDAAKAVAALSPPEPTDKREVVKFALLSLKEHELREVIETLCRVGHIDIRALSLQDHGWQDIGTAPKNKRIGLLIGGEEYIGRWEDDRYAQKPRPYWQHETFGRLQISDQRKEQPTMWRELRAAPAMVAEHQTSEAKS